MTARKGTGSPRAAYNSPGLTQRTTKAGEVRYDATHRGPDGRERSKTLRTKAAAESWRRDQITMLERGSWFDPRAGKITPREWSEKWLNTAVDLRESTLRIYEVNLRLHILPALGDTPLGKLTPTMLREWQADLAAIPVAGRRRAPATVHQAYRTLRRVLGAAVSAELLSRNPMTGVNAPKVEDEEMRFLTPEEVITLVATIDERYRAMVLVATYCGPRAAELVGLRRQRVDLVRRRISIVEQVAERSSGAGFLKGPPKTKAGTREVPIPSIVAEALEAHMARWSEGGPEGLVFTAPTGGPIRWRSWSARFWRPATVTAGVTGLRFHDLRHTCASLAIAAGADVKVLQAMLGHSSAAMTLDLYGKLLPDRLDDVAERLDAMARRAGQDSPFAA
jgi:integrase